MEEDEEVGGGRVGEVYIDMRGGGGMDIRERCERLVLRVSYAAGAGGGGDGNCRREAYSQSRGGVIQAGSVCSFRIGLQMAARQSGKGCNVSLILVEYGGGGRFRQSHSAWRGRLARGKLTWLSVIGVE